MKKFTVCNIAEHTKCEKPLCLLIFSNYINYSLKTVTGRDVMNITHCSVVILYLKLMKRKIIA